MSELRDPTPNERNIILAVIGMVEGSLFRECASREAIALYEKHKTVGQLMYETLGHFRVAKAMEDTEAVYRIYTWKKAVRMEIEAANQSRKMFEDEQS